MFVDMCCANTQGCGDEGVSYPPHHLKGVTILLSTHGEGVNVKILFQIEGSRLILTCIITVYLIFFLCGALSLFPM